MPERVPEPPKHLKVTGKRVWRQAVLDFEWAWHESELLRLFAETLDRCEQARATIAAEGAYFRDRFDQPKAHPALRVEAECRIAAARLARELDLNFDPDSRPPRLARNK
jgi:P27 family predicted phage terminase small subunit